jgi:tetratricopeptide (TPR) repeat protein
VVKTAVAVVVLAAVGLAAYCNSFAGPYIFDDKPSIPDNPYIQHLWPLREAMKAPEDQTVAGRQIISLSLAINYQVSGLDVWSYHAGNLLIHILAALVLYGIVRRTLLLEAMPEKFGRASWPLALACAAIWLVHPLNTGSVTYLIQRAESLMGLFYLLTLYLALRGFTAQTARRVRAWYGLSFVACLIGMFCKEVMFTAPIMVFLYDAIFVSRGLWRPIKRHWPLHALLVATWIAFAWNVSLDHRPKSVGFHFDVSPFEYAATQTRVILHYFELAFWPTGLSLDYQWPIARHFAEYAVTGPVLLMMLCVAVWLIARKPMWGYLAAWVFLILGPTSSFLPIVTEVAADHRMYLPLIGIVVGVVMLVYVVGAWAVSTRPALGAVARPAGAAAAVALVAAMGWRTFERNHDYRSREAIWADATRKVPGDARAWHNLGTALADDGRDAEAVKDFTRAVELDPLYVSAYAHRGISYSALGKYPEAIADYEKALELDPNNSKAKIGLGVVAEKSGDAQLARQRFLEAVEKDPGSAIAWSNLGSTYDRAGDYARAAECFDKAVALDPKFANAWVNRGTAYDHMDRLGEAVESYTRAIQIEPTGTEAYRNRASVYVREGKGDLALADYGEALRMAPSPAVASAMLRERAGVYERVNRPDDAMADYDRAVELAPDDQAAHKARGAAYSRRGMLAQAAGDLGKVVELEPSAENYNSRGIVYGKMHENDRAIADFTKAMEMDPGYSPPYSNRGMALLTTGHNAEAAADLAKAVQLDPSAMASYVNLGQARAALGEYDEAVAALESGLKLAQQSSPGAVPEIQRRLESYKALAKKGG